MYHKPQLLFVPLAALVGAGAAVVAASVILRFVGVAPLRYPPGGLSQLLVSDRDHRRGVEAQMLGSPHTDLISLEAPSILAQIIEVRIPRQELWDSYARISRDNAGTGVESLPSVQVASRRNT